MYFQAFCFIEGPFPPCVRNVNIFVLVLNCGCWGEAFSKPTPTADPLFVVPQFVRSPGLLGLQCSLGPSSDLRLLQEQREQPTTSGVRLSGSFPPGVSEALTSSGPGRSRPIRPLASCPLPRGRQPPRPRGLRACPSLATLRRRGRRVLAGVRGRRAPRAVTATPAARERSTRRRGRAR